MADRIPNGGTNYFGLSDLGPFFVMTPGAALLRLESHRALFQPVFDKLSGVIVHLANKDMEGDEGKYWFAGNLMDWQDDDALVFLPDTLLDVRDLMLRLIAASPQRRITFSTDYQFGGEKQECGEITLSRFLQLHGS